MIAEKDIPAEDRELINLDENADENQDRYDDIRTAKRSYQTCDYEEEYLDWYKKTFTTPSGDKMVAFGWYGNDY